MQKRPVYPIHPGEVLADELAEMSSSYVFTISRLRPDLS
jgi:plasmid maintenance system antidote protein VapI